MVLVSFQKGRLLGKKSADAQTKKLVVEVHSIGYLNISCVAFISILYRDLPPELAQQCLTTFLLQPSRLSLNLRLRYKEWKYILEVNSSKDIFTFSNALTRYNLNGRSSGKSSVRFFSGQVRTLDVWLGSMNATSMLYCPPPS